MRNNVWYEKYNTLFVALIALYVQFYFCYRLYAISKLWWIVAPILFLYLVAVGSVATAIHYIANIQESGKLASWLSAHYAIVFAADMLLAGTTAYFLLKTKTNVLPQYVVYCFHYFPMPTIVQDYWHDKCAGTAYVSNCHARCCVALPKLYAISMMWTLNARRRIRVANGSSSLTGGTSNEPNRLDFSRSMMRRRASFCEDIAMSGIQIVTHTESRFDEDMEAMPTKKGIDSPSEEDTKS
ncbi:hypothetical protein DFS33DRAFT_1103950 [Desarmillaria ectypa]|nr:hypothetical protein DFS33DRAFT_1103950 [Desarmillaria ectypa]